MAVGCKVVLRKSLMYAFLDRFISITLPRIKNFQGFYQSLITMDGNLSLKLREPLSFLELEYEYDTFLELPPIDITFVTTSVGKKESLSLLSSLQVPFTK
jgi:large subunit ribosomal protein L5